MLLMAPRNRAKLKGALKDNFQIRGAEILEIQKKMKEVIIYYVPGKKPVSGPVVFILRKHMR